MAAPTIGDIGILTITCSIMKATGAGTALIIQKWVDGSFAHPLLMQRRYYILYITIQYLQ